MKNRILNFIRTLTLAISIIASSFTAINGQTITSDKTGDHGGYFYSFYTDGGGTASMTLGAGGNYTTSWTNCGNFTAGKGWRTGGDRAVSFSGSFNPSGNGMLCVYGWTLNPLIEYYIVESYGTWTPPGDATSLGKVYSDDGEYDIYKMRRYNADNITGRKTDFDQYWSVRKTKRSSGTVNTGNHFYAWAQKGLNLGTHDYMILETEGYQSSGSSNMTVGTTSAYSVTVRARGVTGAEQIRLVIGGNYAKTWTLTKTMADYTVSTTNTGSIRIEYFNDATGRDVQIDYLKSGSTIWQAEAQTTNTGVYQNGRCGGSRSEWMHCNGYIGFSALKSGNIEPDQLNDESESPLATDDFMVFPNPIKDMVNISISRIIEEKAIGEIYNLSGTSVKQFDLVTGTNTIDVKELGSGMYVIKMIVNDEIITRKIVK